MNPYRKVYDAVNAQLEAAQTFFEIDAATTNFYALTQAMNAKGQAHHLKQWMLDDLTASSKFAGRVVELLEDPLVVWED
ncbi:hypothetical protein LEM8419_03505 [Neolewinella maritima]|uniref:Uncharacterized protein n=1 Tax=Neolewinella maritima TaxID=1383882 RepID=A0ABM9B5K6_9BACT|nr:hypothetical protein [Neolewinella maritima]CAH1002633.1 hypothetical protein LEM8419_03505 [Neolewinella maritima]